jgi:hypothetical protein
MSPEEIPIPCDLSRLAPRQREREQELLARFKREVRGLEESEHGWKYSVAAEPETLAAVGELLALERLCCPFLELRLEVSNAALACVHVFGRPGTKPFVAAEFGG